MLLSNPMMSIIKEKETRVIEKTHMNVMDHYIASKPNLVQGKKGPMELDFAGTLEHLI